MPFPVQADQTSPTTAQLVEMALRMLQQNVEKHLEQGNRLERLYAGWNQNWMSQYAQLTARIDTLESRLRAAGIEDHKAPQLSLISHQEDAA